MNFILRRAKDTDEDGEDLAGKTNQIELYLAESSERTAGRYDANGAERGPVKTCRCTKAGRREIRRTAGSLTKVLQRSSRDVHLRPSAALSSRIEVGMKALVI